MIAGGHAGVIGSFLVTLSILSGALISYRMGVGFRRAGRRAVRDELARRGETPLAIEDRPMPFVSHERTGLSAAVLFRIRARASHGQERSYEWAFDRPMFGQARGLKQLAGGIWIPLA